MKKFYFSKTSKPKTFERQFLQYIRVHRLVSIGNHENSAVLVRLGVTSLQILKGCIRDRKMNKVS